MPYNLSPQQADDIIRTMLGEAAGESPTGQAAVAYTVLNRSKDPRWSTDPSKVVHQPGQFSAWNSGAGGNDLVKIGPEDPRYQQAKIVLDGIQSGKISDPTGGAVNYYSPSGMNSLVADGSQSNAIPTWLGSANAERPSGPIQIGNQIFTGQTSGTGGNTNSPATGDQYIDPGKTFYSDPATKVQYDQSSSSDEEKTPSAYDQWVTKHMPWLTQSRADKLLAIGSGLLSGANWAEGMGASGANLLALRRDNERRDQANQDAAADYQRKMSAIDFQGKQSAATEAARAAAAAKAYQSPFNITGIDKKTGLQRVMPATFDNGSYSVIGEDGKSHDPNEYLHDWRRGGSSDDPTTSVSAGGIPNATSYTPGTIPTFNLNENQGKSMSYALRAIGANRDLDTITKLVGPDKMASINAAIGQWAAQHSTDRISGALLNSALDGSGLQGEARVAMSQYLQSVLRDDTGAAYTGEEFTNYGSAFLPSAGDNEDTIAYKSKTRNRAVSALISKAGPAAPWLNGVMSGQYDLPDQGIVYNGDDNFGANPSAYQGGAQGQSPQVSQTTQGQDPQAPTGVSPENYDPRAYAAPAPGFESRGWNSLSPAEKVRAYQLTNTSPKPIKPATSAVAPNRPPASYKYGPGVWAGLSDAQRQNWIATHPEQ